MYGWAKRIKNAFKFPLIASLIVVVVFEWLEYSLTPFIYWPNLPLSSVTNVRMLVVADPQLLGYRHSPPHLFGSLCCWDADRYIGKTFSLAFNYVNPDLILFLGDIFDEGEIATDEEFHSYFQRFKYIFEEVNFNKAIVIPGDNDIGGEDQPPLSEMERRFDTYFRDDVLLQHKFLEIVKVNYITHSNKYEVAPNISEGVIRVALSHIPLTPSYSSFVSRVIPYLQPHIILSAHEHKSEYVIADRKTGIIVRPPSLKTLNTYAFNISESILHEILVPTCSYRMGTSEMGYSVLDINKFGETSYTVLWLPSRFRQLLAYLIVLVYAFLSLVILLLKFTMRDSHSLKVFHEYGFRTYS